MCSRLFLIVLLLALACTPYSKMRRITSGELVMGLSVSDEEPLEEDEDIDFQIDSIRSTLSDGPIIMNAIRDSQTGEMVATDVISASKVVARFRNVAERAGMVSISFDLSVPSGMADSRWRLKICPEMSIQNDTVPLDPIFITGKDYRAAQLRGYERYRQFIAGIITDTTDLIRLRQLELFLQRHYPETFALKNDSTIIPEPLAENLYGVTQMQVKEHYMRHLKMRLNQRRKDRADEMYRRFVKDPIDNRGVRLDTVLVGDEGDFTYRYVYTFKSRPRLRKVGVSLHGDLYEKGERLLELPFPEDLTFYISSLSTLADDRPRYRMIVLERTVYDNTKALIDFAQGKSDIDTLLGDNASELKRIRKCVDDVVARRELVLDSLVVTASCSPEGTYRSNRLLSRARSESVLAYMQTIVPDSWKDSLRTSELPENWEQLSRLVTSDGVLDSGARDNILKVINSGGDHDRRERRLASLPEYRYLREKLYPQLRSVQFDFYLHRAGMVKDTVHTTELDTVYMAGVKALKGLDYKKAVELLRPYGDFNAALAYMSADYNYSALDVLDRLDDTDAKVCYLKAMVLSRMGLVEEAMKYFRLALTYDPYMEHRANLDPEMHTLINLYKQL